MIENEYKVKLPLDDVSLIKKLGYFNFSKSIMSKSICQIPNITGENDLVPVEKFLSWGKKAGSIEGILEMYADQLPNRFVPFAEGESGDL